MLDEITSLWQCSVSSFDSTVLFELGGYEKFQ